MRKYLYNHLRSAGFTIVELVIVVLVLGILAAVAAPRFFNTTSDAQVAAIMQHIRVGHDAAERFYAKNGRFPRDANRGVFPADFAGLLAPTYFTAIPPGGGKWDWNSEARWGDVYCGMSIYSDPPPLLLWQEVDNCFDNGDLRTGYITMFQNKTLQFELVP